jgi:hypothetical protein
MAKKGGELYLSAKALRAYGLTAEEALAKLKAVPPPDDDEEEEEWTFLQDVYCRLEIELERSDLRYDTRMEFLTLMANLVLADLKRCTS